MRSNMRNFEIHKFKLLLSTRSKCSTFPVLINFQFSFERKKKFFLVLKNFYNYFLFLILLYISACGVLFLGGRVEIETCYLDMEMELVGKF